MRSLPLLLAVAALHSAGRAGDLPPLPPQPAGVPLPTLEWPTAEPAQDVDRARLDAAFASAFEATGPGGVSDTRALLAVHHGAIVAERYAPGFGPESRFHSWSASKSVTQALVGILVREGRLDVRAPANVPEWRGDGDPRARITLDQLLHMNSGLANEDERQEFATTFAANLIVGPGAVDVAAYARRVPLAHEPGTHWAYSTGTSMILAEIVARTLGAGGPELLDFMRHELFEPLGMRSAVPEFDVAGNFMGGGFFYASARDYARFGLLYLRDGVWNGARVLPEGWVDYTRTPQPANGAYGAHFWLNQPPVEGQFPVLPGAPISAFCANGNGGQIVAVVPTRDLVVVRLGELHTLEWPELTKILVRLIDAFPPVAAET